MVYRADALDDPLQQNVVAWLDSGKGASADGISQRFAWYEKDFVAHSGSVDAFIAAYRTEGLTGVDTSRSLEYDWTLNIASDAVHRP